MRGSGVLVGALVLALATGVSRLDPAEVAPSAPALCAKPATLKTLTADKITDEFAAGLPRDSLIYFYKEGCPFCKRFKPVIGCVADALKGDPEVAFYRFEGPSHEDMKDRFAVSSYPTLRFFPKGFILDASYFGKEMEGSTDDPAVVREFIRSVRGKTVAQLQDGTPASANVQVKLDSHAAKGKKVVVNGKQVDTFATVTQRRSIFFIHHGDLTVKTKGICTGETPCLTLTAPPSLCRPRVRVPHSSAQRHAGGQVVWYNCQRPGLCRIRGVIAAAPKPVVIHWTKVCSGASVIGLDVGTVQGTPDVVKDGKVAGDWLPTPFRGEGDVAVPGVLPVAQVGASETETSFYIDIAAQDDSKAPVLLHAVHVGIWSPAPLLTGSKPMLTVEVAGPVPRDVVALTRFSGRPGVENVALGKKNNVSMSSVWAGHAASIAVDGDTGDMLRGHLSCAVSGKQGRDPEPYWEIDLGAHTAKTSIVKSVIVWNTPSPDTRYRIVPFWILLSGTGSSKFPRSLASARNAAQYYQRFDIVERVYRWVLGANDAFTRRVRIQMELTDYLQIAEVQVNVVRSSRRCPDPVPDNVDPLCEKTAHGNTVQTTVKYTCNAPGQAVLNLTLPVYPEFEAYAPPRFSWVKICASELNGAVTIGSTAQAQDVVANGIVAPNYAPQWRWNESAAAPLDTAGSAVRNAFPTLLMVPGTTRKLRFYTMLSQMGAKQRVGAPRVKLMHPHLADPVVESSSINGTLTDTAKSFDVVFGCRAQGYTVVEISIPIMPAYQPYKPIVIQFVKYCGGPPLGLDVSAGRASRGPDGSGPEVWVPDLKMEAIKSGETTAAFRQPSDVMVIPETQIYSRFFVTIPVGERETVDGTGRPFKGHVPTATAPCDKNPSKRCRMLPRKTSAALVAHTIEATCDPPICAAKWVGSGVGPPLFGELVGDPEYVDGKVPAPNNTVQFSLNYYCTKAGPTVVQVDFKAAFYDTVTMKFRKQCKPWKQTTVGITTITISVLVLFITLIVMFCFCTTKGQDVLEKFFFKPHVLIPDGAGL